MAKSTVKNVDPGIGGMVVKYVLVSIMVALLVFAIVYIVRVSQGKEKFTEQSTKRVVYIYSDQCGHCTRFTKNTWNEFESRVAPTIPNTEIFKYEKSSVEAQPYLKFVSGYPTVLMFEGVNPQPHTQVGNTDLDTLVKFVNS